MSTSGINFAGLGTGIDTESIIQQLLKVDSQPIQVLQARQQAIQQQQAAVNQISAAISGLQAAAATLTGPSAFSVVQGTSSDATVATITTDAGAQAGSHTLQVLQLAQAQKLASATQTSLTTPLGVSGQFVINGKAVTVNATDTLQTLVAAINNAQAGVNASIVSTAANSYTVVLSAANTGTANAISLSDVGSGSILQNTLGLVGSSASIRSPITNGAASSLFADSSTSVGTLLGLTAPPAGSIQINGVSVSIDFSTDSLTTIAGKINAAAIPGVTASVVAVTDPNTGASRQQLQIVGASTPTFTDNQNILANLGILQHAPVNQLAAAKDASFTLDGLSITRSSNTVSDVLSGVTINLLKDTGQPTVNLTISPDINTIKSNIQAFVNQYNQIIKTFNNVASFDPQTLTSGPLFGDVTIQNAVNSITQIITGSVTGLTGVSTLAQLGITLDQTNQLNIDDTTLTNALNGNLAAVAKVFQAVGTSTDSGVAFISATEKTKPSTGSGYAINVTQLATQASVTAGTQHTADNNPDVETLTFTGNPFPGGKTILLNANSTLDGIVSQINADPTLSGVLTASNAGGYLKLTSKLYGSNQGFTVVSSQPAASNNSGIGNAPITATALDVAGTINGEPATGNGQFLTGAAGNANTDGLQVRITAPTTGSHGPLVFTQGIAALVKYFANDATDSLTGTLSLYSNSLGDQVTDISSTIKDMQAALNDEETRLRQQFTEMETAVVQLRAAASGLSGLAMPTAMSTSSSSSSSSGR